MDLYRRPVAHEEFRNEIEIKRSRFITVIRRATTEQEARDVINELKNEFPDARHHCSAFIVHVDDAVPVERSSDDGEPSGTAGTPMLDVVRGSGLLDIVAVVVRYFGGVKLGAGGLVHAYSDSVSQCLELDNVGVESFIPSRPTIAMLAGWNLSYGAEILILLMSPIATE